jgi:O-antigen/teichoic acid export membrane protein
MISLALVPVAAGISVLAGPIMRILYGTEFEPGALALRIAVWGIAVYGLAVVMGRVLLSIQKQNIIFYVSLFSVILNVTLNFIMIPKWGIQGAAAASLATIGAVAFLNYLAVGRFVGRPHLGHLLWKIYASGVVMAAAVWVMRGDMPLWLIVPAGAAIYVILILVSGALDDKDKEMLRALYRRGKP